MKKYAFNLPINSTSLGQVSLSILREIHSRNLDIFLFPIGPLDLSSISDLNENDFISFLHRSVQETPKTYSRNIPIFKLWHIAGSLESLSLKQNLLTFYEVDNPTDVEINIIKNNNKVYLSNSFSVELFKSKGLENVNFMPLGFDNKSFNLVRDTSKQRDVIHFGLFGKLEPSRKRHLKTLTAWAEKFGNNPKYALHCAIYNNFLDPRVQSQIILNALNNKKYWNINFLPHIPSNKSYNELLNHIDIVLAMSGGEGWGLPEFQSVALGKHCLGLNAHAYKDWMTKENAITINPTKTKIDVYDDMFFKKGQDFNQGQIFDWNKEEFHEGLDSIVNRFLENPVNLEGLKLQENFKYSKMVDQILLSLDNSYE